MRVRGDLWDIIILYHLPVLEIMRIRSINRIGLDDFVCIKSNNKVFRFRITKSVVVMSTVCPCLISVLDTDPPGHSEHGLEHSRKCVTTTSREDKKYHLDRES